MQTKESSFHPLGDGRVSSSAEGVLGNSLDIGPKGVAQGGGMDREVLAGPSSSSPAVICDSLELKGTAKVDQNKVIAVKKRKHSITFCSVR